MSAATVAVFRPDDERIDEAVEYLRSRGASPVADPMLTVRATGERPGTADYCVFTSPTAVELAVEAGWDPGRAVVCAVGDRTADALRDRGYTVGVVPAESTSTGLVEALAEVVDGRTVEIARSAHGSDVLPDGLEKAGATVRETRLYRLDCPETAGRSVALAAAGDLDGLLFTSPRIVEHFLTIAEERERFDAVRRGLEAALVGAIGDPTAGALRERGLPVDVVPEQVGFEELADAVLTSIEEA